MTEREARERPELNETRVPGWTLLLTLILCIHKVGGGESILMTGGVPGTCELCGTSELLEWIKSAETGMETWPSRGWV